MHRFLFLVVVAALPDLLGAQSITQLWYDFPAEAGQVDSYTATSLSDGGAFLGLLFEEDWSEFGGMRVDMDGNPVWARKWTGGPSLMLWEYGSGEWGPDHLFIFGGAVSQPMVNLFLARTTSNGDLLWANRYDLDTGNYDFDRVTARTTPDGGVLMTVPRDAYVDLVKVDINGQVVWAQRINTAPDQVSYCNLKGLVFAPNGDIVLTGWSFGKMSITRLLPDGTMIWSRSYPLAISPLAIANTPDGGFVIGGERYGYDFAMKVDELGAPIWAKSYITSGDEDAGWISGISIDELGRFLFTTRQTWGAYRALRTMLCDEQGQLLDARKVSGGVNMEVLAGSTLSFHDGLFTGAGMISGTPGGSSDAMPFFWRLPADGPVGCFRSPFPVSVNDISGFVPTDAGIMSLDTVSVVPLSYSAVEVTVTTSDFCSNVSVPDPAIDPSPTLSPTVLEAGELIHVQGLPTSVRITVMDPSGRVVTLHPSGASIATDGWVPGVYSIVAMDAARPIGRWRCVVVR